MADHEDLGTLDPQVLIRLLNHSSRDVGAALSEAKTASDRVRVHLQFSQVAPSAMARLLHDKIDEMRVIVRLTPSEERVIRATRRFVAVTTEIEQTRAEVLAQVRSWADENTEAVISGVQASFDEHLGGQVSAIAKLTDDELRRLRYALVVDAAMLGQRFLASFLSNCGSRPAAANIGEAYLNAIQPRRPAPRPIFRLAPEQTTESFLRALIAGSVPSLAVAQARVSSLSRGELSLAGWTITEGDLPNRSVLVAALEGLRRATDLEFQLGDIEREEDTAVTALDEEAARSRWDAAAPSD
ncbi:hypothetical protein PTQ19_11850 [Microbacterium esteraromaticum]|uniref:hypothetical protein n=1 Tax=Microbacterium esteraromaticum TaxID=57043 RepID=UPI001C942902|nr:hypothetical protein [Microbacterium esteraromaticum]MBY6061027.1 hypothetical protein [Microbacterium esteraromaticum]WDH78205.1 hypothetical protein PTQ19_11850 [Microbacterium esteraromaticum]